MLSVIVAFACYVVGTMWRRTKEQERALVTASKRKSEDRDIKVDRREILSELATMLENADDFKKSLRALDKNIKALLEE